MHSADYLDSVGQVTRRWANEIYAVEGRTVYMNYGASRGLFQLSDNLRDMRNSQTTFGRNADGFLARVIELLPTCLK